MQTILDKLSLMSPNLISLYGTRKKIMFSKIRRLALGHGACAHKLESTRSARLCGLPLKHAMGLSCALMLEGWQIQKNYRSSTLFFGRGGPETD